MRENIIYYNKAISQNYDFLSDQGIGLKELAITYLLANSGIEKEANETYNYEVSKIEIESVFFRIVNRLALELLDQNPTLFKKEKWLEKARLGVIRFYSAEKANNPNKAILSKILYDVQTFEKLYNLGFIKKDSLFAIMVFYLWKEGIGVKIKTFHSSSDGKRIAKNLLRKMIKENPDNEWLKYLWLRYLTAWTNEDVTRNSEWYLELMNTTKDKELQFCCASALVDLGLRLGNQKWVELGTESLTDIGAEYKLNMEYLTKVKGWFPQKINA